VLILSGAPEVEWIFDDGTTSSESSPVKDYGSSGVRSNRLYVNPWSALSRINIGYDGEDGGSSAIEHVADQQVSSVEGLDLVAPYLRQWCSSYNNIESLDFSDFINLDTIECYLSGSLKYVDLTNTPSLKRICFEDCDLAALDLSDCTALEDLRGALNSYSSIDFGDVGDNTWHICVRDNTFGSNLFSDMSNLPKIVELFIWQDNQSGSLVIPSTGTSRNANILAYGNDYTYVDLRGALQNTNLNGTVSLYNNRISEILIDGCVQINNLYLQNNLLDSDQVDYILGELDSMGRANGVLKIYGNSSPSSDGLQSMSSLIDKGWTIEDTAP